ncbi:MAG TPA: methyltransferase domain-containing protein [Pyrinomonadaceae bacterium]
MRLAYFSPLSPQRSGISDYSEELLPHLAAGARIDLFVDGFEPSNAETCARFRWFDYVSDPAALERLDDYDAVVYHLGNDHRYHSGIYDAASRRPGVVVFHDFALQDFFLGLARERGDVNIYLDEVGSEHGPEERARAAEALARGGLPSHFAAPLHFPLNRRLALGAEAVITHSRLSAARFEQLAPGTPVAHVNHHVTEGAASREPPTRDTADAANARPVRLASFGLITPGKGVGHALRALSALKDDYDFRYTLVGETNPFYDVRALIREHGLSERVEITGHVTLDEFERRIAETDVALNLRTRTCGEASGSLCRIMAAGVAAVVSDAGWFSELPEGAVVKVDAGRWLDAELRAYLERLLADAALRESVGARARRHVLAEHRIEQSAARYLSFIDEVIGGRARRRLVRGVSAEISRLRLDPEADTSVISAVAAEVAALAPERAFAAAATTRHAPEADTHAASSADTSAAASLATSTSEESASASDERDAGSASSSSEQATTAVADEGAATTHAPGRLRKVEGVDYKRAAVEYPRKLDAERHHYLFTKPFYNLSNKPPKHEGDGMDPETHRHFCDFANLAVALALPPGRRLLDVGCGSGWLSEYFARLGYEVTGIDISPELIEIARQRTACVPYDVDHETPIVCRFLVHDAESAPLDEVFDAAFCYDSLHHFEDERAVMRHLSEMVSYGGMLFILEGGKPDEGSETAAELTDVMRLYETLESPFDPAYLRALLREHGFLVVGDYVSVNGLFERDSVENERVRFVQQDLNYLLCKKVTHGVSPADGVPDSRAPGRLSARITAAAATATDDDAMPGNDAVPGDEAPARPPTLSPGADFGLSLEIENTGDTVWLTGAADRRGAVMLGVRVFDDEGRVVLFERHGEPPLPRPLAPGERVRLALGFRAPDAPGRYQLKLDLVAQHVCWFEQHGSAPLVMAFEVQGIDSSAH